MAQNTQKNTQSLKIAPETASDAPQSDKSTIRNGTSLRAIVAAQAGSTVQNKQAFMGDIRQKLAQVADEAKKHGEEAKETEGLAATAATRLYIARRDGMVTGDELSALLGDVFGYTPKQDGTPGRTPAGPGRTIRMRIVRALQGHDFINGGDGGRFYETMDAEEVAPIINSIGKTEVKDVNGEKKEVLAEGASVWNAYKVLGDLKSKGTVRLPFAFDAKKVLGLQDALSEPGARDKIIGNPSLLKAWLGLLDQLLVIDQVDDNEVAAIQAKVAGQATEAEAEAEAEADDETETETEEEGGQIMAA